MKAVERVEILGVPVDAVDLPAAVARAAAALAGEGAPLRILAVNPEKVMTLHDDPWLLDFFRSTELLIPDGIGVVWAARTLHGVRASRVPGADLMVELCRMAAARGHSIYLLGAAEEVNAGAAATLASRFPGLRVAGRRNGYFRPEESAAIVDDINASGAGILFVALGSPRQERWIAEHLERLRPRVMQGIGGTLDTVTGRVRRAPRLFQRMHLEWFYRLASDPRRLRRQMKLPRFAGRVIAQRLAPARKRAA